MSIGRTTNNAHAVPVLVALQGCAPLDRVLTFLIQMCELIISRFFYCYASKQKRFHFDTNFISYLLFIGLHFKRIFECCAILAQVCSMPFVHNLLVIII